MGFCVARYSCRRTRGLPPQLLPLRGASLLSLYVLVGLLNAASTQPPTWKHASTLYSSSSLSSTSNSSSSAKSMSDAQSREAHVTRSTCVESRIRCAVRKGCGSALQGYMLDCDDLMAGRINYCDNYCKSSLIALTSTEEGAQLMECRCNDDYCKETKERVEVCREEVLLANARDSVVSCNVAHLICSVDAQCATALSYYDKFCRKMFAGKSCSYHCNNSISILARQEKAAKLATCECDGTEPFECQTIKTNMARLCFNQIDDGVIERQEEETNEIDTTSVVLKNSTSCAAWGNYWGRGRLSWRQLRIVLFTLVPSAVVRWKGASQLAVAGLGCLLLPNIL